MDKNWYINYQPCTQTEYIMYNLIYNNMAGYFYYNDCRINFSNIYGFYVKNWDKKTKIMTTINITLNIAKELIENSLNDNWENNPVLSLDLL